MAIFLLELPQKGGQVLVNGTKSMLVEADSAANAREVASALADGDSPWGDSDVTASDVTSLSASNYAGWTYEVTVREPTLGGIGGVIEKVSFVATASETTVDSIGTAIVTPLNATGSIGNASYDGGTDTLTVAGAADNLGDKSLQLRVFPPNSKAEVPFMVGTITHEGLASAALTVVLTVPTAIPKLLREHK